MARSAQNPLRLPIRNKALNRLATRLLGLGPLMDIYAAWRTSPAGGAPSGERLLDHALKSLNAHLEWQRDAALPDLPQQGPLIVVANHPLGGLDGMLLTRELLKQRSDTKVLVNELLLRFPEFNDLFIGLDVLGAGSRLKNAAGIRAACRHLQSGGTLLVFPAGTVSGISVRRFNIEDPAWNDFVGRLALRYRAACLPVRVNARNSLGFYFSALIHKRLRTALLPRELANKRDAVVYAAAGELVSAREIEQLQNPADVTRSLRLASDLLALRSHQYVDSDEDRQEAPIAGNVEIAWLDQRIAALQPYELVRDGMMSVYCAPYEALGCVMTQIAIDRETTFRAVNEGTGRELDSDHFDPFYWHLWVWDHANSRIVGAYRIGKVDEIVNLHGIDCLYSSSLYKFGEVLLQNLAGTIEVGRSFVAIPYQRHPKALDLLWRGIGEFVVQNPGYHTLFGCVSISRQYSTQARAFLADTMMKNFAVSLKWQQHVRAQSPLRVSGKSWSAETLASLNSIAIINKLLGSLDRGKRIPILLRHYLALNGRFAAFTVNRGFNDSLDGLIFVDLRLAPEKYLNRYLGVEGSRYFRQLWSENEKAA